MSVAPVAVKLTQLPLTTLNVLVALATDVHAKTQFWLLVMKDG